MFLKQEKSEIDDFERKKKIGSKGKILKKIFCKNTKYSCTFFCFGIF